MKKFFTIIVCLFILLGWYNVVMAADEDGTTLHWNNTRTIKVYIPYHQYEKSLRHAFEYWERATDKHLHFIMVHTPSLAQDKVIFVDKLDGNAVGLTRKEWRTIKYADGKEKNELSGVKIYIAMKNVNGEQMSRDQIYTIALHEIGHSLGLGHNNNPKSIMYPNAYQYGLMEVTKQDIKDLYNLYGWRY